MEKETSDQTSILELHEIKHSFDGKRVLSEVSLVLTSNEIVAILGKSGSGKSTLLQIINGLIKPDQGMVKLFGQPLDYSTIHAARLQMGYVIQQVGLFPHMSIQSNICLLGKISHQSKVSMVRRLNQLMDMVQLPTSCLKKYPHELSGGEQQRVGICRAMFLNPPVLIMDEPFGSLDYETKRNIYRHLLLIQRNEPRTVVLVTHDWDEATILADKFIWIEEGKVRAAGNKAELGILKTSIFG